MNNRFSTIAAVCLLLATVFAFLPVPAGGAPPGAGNWVLNTSDTCNGQTWVVNGDLLIQNGGTLTLTNNCVLQVRGDINVAVGGALNVDNSELYLGDGGGPFLGGFLNFGVHGSLNVTGGSLVSSWLQAWNTRYVFAMWASSSVNIDGSEVRDCGVYDNPLGISLYTSQATINGNDIHDCIHGIQVVGSKPTITANDINNNWDIGISAERGANPTINRVNVIRDNGDGGIFLMSANATINGNTINNNGNGGGEWGLFVLAGSPTVTNNTFANNVGGGGSNDGGAIFITQLSSPVVRDNTLTGNDLGFVAEQGSTPELVRNTIGGTTGRGIWYNSNAGGKVEDNTVTIDNSDAVRLDTQSQAVMKRNIIRHNNGGGWGVLAQNYAVLDMDGDSIRANNGALNANNWVTGTYKNSWMTGGNTGGAATLEVNWHSDLTITNATITATGFSDAIAMNNGYSTLILDDAQVHSWQADAMSVGNGWASSSNVVTITDSTITAQDDGIFSWESDLELRNSDVWADQGVALMTMFDATTTVAESSVNSNQSIGIWTENSVTSFVNSTLTSDAGSPSINFNNGWLQQTNFVDMLNSTFDQSTPAFADQWALLNVSWFADVRVIWAGSGNPVPAATLNLTNSTGSRWWSRTTPGNGELPWLVVREYSETINPPPTNHNPWNFLATKGALSGQTNLSVTQSMTGSNRIAVPIDDPTPPVVAIVTPVTGAMLNISDVPVGGTAADAQSGVDQVRVTVDSRPAFVAAGTTTWSYIAQGLSDGPHLITAQAFNGAGKSSNPQTISITVDTTPPVVVIGSPANGSLLNVSKVMVSGTIDDLAAVLELNGGTVLGDGAGKWETNITLPDGPHTLSITATDLLGNAGSDAVGITIDTAPPMVEILSPKTDGTKIPSLTTGLFGTAEVAAELWLTVNSRPAVQVTNSNGVFSLDVTLDEDMNTMSLLARDEAGNEATAVRTIIARPNPPAVNVTWPTDGLLLNVSAGTVTGWTDADELLINGKVVTIGANGTFTLPVDFVEGTNVVEIYGKDIFGRSTIWTAVVDVDLTAPLLSVEKPAAKILINFSRVDVVGLTEPGSDLTVGGNAVLLADDGRFSVGLNLTEGTHHVAIVSTDEAGNSATVDRDITVDLTPPLLNITAPAGAKGDRERVRFTGTTEPGARVWVHGKEATVDSAGSWAIDVALEDGPFTYVVRAVDPAGNEALKTKDFQRTGIFVSAGGSNILLFLIVGLLMGAIIGAVVVWATRKKRQPPAPDYLATSEGGMAAGQPQEPAPRDMSPPQSPPSRPAAPTPWAPAAAPVAGPAAAPVAGPAAGTSAGAEAAPATFEPTAPPAPAAAPSPAAAAAPTPATESKRAEAEAKPGEAEATLEDIMKKLG